MAYDPNANAKLKNIRSLAQYAAEKIDENIHRVSISDAILNTVPGSVNGAMWYEVNNNTPAVKFYYGGFKYSITSELALLDPNLTLSSYSVNMGTTNTSVDVSYSGSGTITVSSSNSNLTASYNSSTKKIALSCSMTASPNTATVTVNLSAAGNYAAASRSISVTFGRENSVT